MVIIADRHAGMQKLKKYKFIIMLLVSCLFTPAVCLSATGNKADWLDTPVTVRFQDESLNKVLGDISQQAGIVLFYDQKLADKKVSGSYKEVKLSEAINRLFSEDNKSIQVFRGEKKIIVKTFGAKKFIQAGTALSDDQVNFVSQQEAGGMVLTELEGMQNQQSYRVYKRYIAEDNEVIDGGMTRAELRAMHARQDKEYRRRLADDNEILDGGMTRAELKAMHARQDKEYKKRLADGNEILDGK